ncbi:DUF1656 domain-containing protein [Pararhizobium mangrovi]|uniref:DUF1656 domain-containing protein n=1 Tax=Pararhizobium mangrovi TaxID=2590452 RepID=A0A506U4Z4_9HYPH|nr:DUF1656 domain-containing protein [Pararhizobium mangrovi]
MAEFDIYGVFVPALLVFAVCAAALTMVVRRVLVAVGFYRLVWHPSLFDVALFVVAIGVVFLIVNNGAQALPVIRALHAKTGI